METLARLDMEGLVMLGVTIAVAVIYLDKALKRLGLYGETAPEETRARPTYGVARTRPDTRSGREPRHYGAARPETRVERVTGALAPYRDPPMTARERAACEVLGLDTQVRPSAGEVAKAYRGRVRRVHPDAGGSSAALRDVVAAYEQMVRHPYPDKRASSE